jgi:hypothetical protein
MCKVLHSEGVLSSSRIEGGGRGRERRRGRPETQRTAVLAIDDVLLIMSIEVEILLIVRNYLREFEQYACVLMR